MPAAGLRAYRASSAKGPLPLTTAFTNNVCENGPACACTSDTVRKFGLSRYPRDAVSGARSKIDCSKTGSGHSSNDGREIG
jgi:hypothetical protein